MIVTEEVTSAGDDVKKKKKFMSSALERNSPWIRTEVQSATGMSNFFHYGRTLCEVLEIEEISERTREIERQSVCNIAAGENFID